jgi:O-antigen ligase
MLAVAAVLSGSRGGLLAFVVAGLALVVLLVRPLRSSALFGCAAAVGLTIWYGLPHLAADSSFVSQRYSLAELQGNDFSNRLPLLSDAWAIFTSHPWVGGGMDVFYGDVGRYVGLDYVHNFPAAVAAETGILGVVAMLLCLGVLLRAGKPWRSMSPDRVGCAVLALYIAVESLFSGDYYDTRFAWVYAIVAVNFVATVTTRAGALTIEKATARGGMRP